MFLWGFKSEIPLLEFSVVELFGLMFGRWQMFLQAWHHPNNGKFLCSWEGSVPRNKFKKRKDFSIISCYQVFKIQADYGRSLLWWHSWHQTAVRGGGELSGNRMQREFWCQVFKKIAVSHCVLLHLLWWLKYCRERFICVQLLLTRRRVKKALYCCSTAPPYPYFPKALPQDRH